MSEPAPYLGTHEFIEQEAHELTTAPLRPAYLGREVLARHVAQLLTPMFQQLLDPLHLPYHLWREAAERGEWVEPALVFGAEITPDLVIQVSNSPTLAIHTIPTDDGKSSRLRIAGAIGEGLISSPVYPGVIVLIYHTGEDEPHMHLQGRETMRALWRTHRIQLLLRGPSHRAGGSG